MSNLDDAMLERMIRLSNEHKAFSKWEFRDLMKPKTYRNKICQLKKQGIVEFAYKSVDAYHILKGYKYEKSGTRHPMGVTVSNNDPIYQMIKNLPMDNPCIHDIHLKFKCPNIYKIFSENTPYPISEINKAIAIPSYTINNAILRTTINKNDTVVLIVGCTLDPIPLTYNGIMRFFGILGTVQGFLYCHTVISNHYHNVESIPQYWNWIITRWDFGQDASGTYNGYKYEIEVKKTPNIFEKYYTKDFGKHKGLRLRHEIIECPKTNVIDAINDKLRIHNVPDSSNDNAYVSDTSLINSNN